MRNKAPYAGIVASADNKDWIVYDYAGKGPYLLVRCYDENDYEKARSAVRTEYSREEGVPKERVGARRLLFVIGRREE